VHCSQFFNKVFEQLRQKPEAKRWTNPGYAKNLIHDIQNSGEWRQVGPGEVQELANKGVIVEGTAVYELKKNGKVVLDKGGKPVLQAHLATAAPTPRGLDPSEFYGKGPSFVEDGNYHPFKVKNTTEAKERHLFPGRYGAINAAIAFGNHPVVWYA